MKKKGNVFWLREDGFGLRGAKGANGRAFRIGPSEDPRSVHMGFAPHVADGSYPRVEGSCLFEAAVAGGRTGARYLTGRGNWDGVLLFVSAAKLCLSERWSSDFGPIKTDWCGVESIGGAFVQVGERHSPEQHQLVVLDVNKFAIVADSRPRFLKVVCEKGVLRGGPPVPKDLGIVLVRRLEFIPNVTHKMMKTTKHALNRLELSDMWTDKLERRMHDLRSH